MTTQIWLYCVILFGTVLSATIAPKIGSVIAGFALGALAAREFAWLLK